MDDAARMPETDAEAGAPSVDAALGAADEAAQRIVGVLVERGVDRADVQTAGVQLYPQYGPEGQPNAGYVARQDLTVTLRDLASAGDLVAAVEHLALAAAMRPDIAYYSTALRGARAALTAAQR